MLPSILANKLLGKFGIKISKVGLDSAEDLISRIQICLITQSQGILHIGAHMGQERDTYNSLKKPVIWIEAIPEIFTILASNISGLHEQQALSLLLGDIDKSPSKFHLASNHLASSSLFEFGSQKGFKGLNMEGEIDLVMRRLDHVFNDRDLQKYNHWVIDVQGAEMKVLQGAGNLIDQCESLLIEVSTREVYASGSTWSDLRSYLVDKNLYPLWEPLENSHENIIFIRKGED
jgi:FkbM family methyltransferase